MPIYSFVCPGCGAQRDIRFPMLYMTEHYKPLCKDCPTLMERLWTAPAVQIVPSASDVLNRALRGEGDPMPGKTMAETQKAAQQMAASHRQRQPRRPDVRKKSKPVTVYPPLMGR
jgi:hypothetical protein